MLRRGYAMLQGFRCISNASCHIWVTAAVPPGCKGGLRAWVLGRGETGNIRGLESIISTRFTELLTVEAFARTGKSREEPSLFACEFVAKMMVGPP